MNVANDIVLIKLFTKFKLNSLNMNTHVGRIIWKMDFFSEQCDM